MYCKICILCGAVSFVDFAVQLNLELKGKKKHIQLMSMYAVLKFTHLSIGENAAFKKAINFVPTKIINFTVP